MHTQTSREQYVYAIQMGFQGPIKIGVSVTPPWRRQELQTGNPYELRILTTFKGGRDLEKSLHNRLAKHRMTGEWFKPHDDVFAALREEESRLGTVSYKEPSHLPAYGWKVCMNCEVPLYKYPGGVGERMVQVEPGERPEMCNPCAEIAALRARGIDPMADDYEPGV